MVVMDTYAFDAFWSTVAPFPTFGNETMSPHYETFFSFCQPKYLSTIPRDNIYRQFISLWFITVPCCVGRTNIVDVRRDSVLHFRLLVVLARLR
jgi:hypothetical protein